MHALVCISTGVSIGTRHCLIDNYHDCFIVQIDFLHFTSLS